MADSYGLKTDRLAGADHYITSVHNGDWLRLRAVDFAGRKPAALEVGFAAIKDGGAVEFYLDHREGKLLARAEATAGGPLRVEVPVQAAEAVDGVHDVFVLFTGGDGELFDVDYWKLSD